MADGRVTALEQEVNKLKQTIDQLAARIEVLESGGGDHHEEEKKKTKRVSKKKKRISSKKDASKKKYKKASAFKKKAKKVVNDNKTKLKKKNKNSYHVFGTEIFVEVPEPFKFGTQHKIGPALRLDLNYAYGYNGSIRGNLVQANDDEIAYALDCTVVCINLADTTKQRFFTGHNKKVVSIAKSPVANIIASGQRDPKGEGKSFICIFDSSPSEETIMPELGRFVDVFTQSVCSVGFTFDGKYVFGVNTDDVHTGSLFDVSWATTNEGQSKILNTATETNLIVSKADVWGQTHAPALINDCYAWVTWGMGCIYSWTYNPVGNNGERVVSKMLGSYAKTKISQKAYTCACWPTDSYLLVGCYSGHIYKYRQGSQELILSDYARLGKFAIISINILDGNKSIYRATDEKGNVYEFQWQEKNKLLREVAFKARGKVTVGIKVGTNTYYGTRANTLQVINYEIKNPESKTLMTSFTKEIWALSAHPTRPWICVGGDDKRLKFWDYEQKSVLWSTNIRSGVRTVDFSCDGNFLVVGTNSGAVQVYEIADPSNIVDPVFDKKVCEEEISAVAFSADVSFLIVGSWDQTLTLIKHYKGNWVQYKKKMKGHTSSITHICLSEDGNFARSDSRGSETLFWDINAGKCIDYCDVNTVWDRWNCIFGWPVQGLFFDSEYSYADAVKCCAISGGNAIDDEGGKKCVASGDETGHLTIFKYPILEEKPAHVDQYLAHSACVTNVRWSNDDAWLFSVGGGDLACFQWKVNEK